LVTWSWQHANVCGWQFGEPNDNKQIGLSNLVIWQGGLVENAKLTPNLTKQIIFLKKVKWGEP